MEFLSLDDLLKINLGEASNNIKVTFRKTVNIKPYETETFEVTNEVTLNRSLTGLERFYVDAIMQAQAEYSVYANLYNRGMMSREEFKTKKEDITNFINSVKVKIESLQRK
ncbi:MAG: hypothetical protein QXD03_05305 [Candidatus Anstonellales archaeon]